MGRWTQYDEDEYRLPEGMERIGYDADTQTYHFRDADGSIWKGAEGAEYSEMTRGKPPHFALNSVANRKPVSGPSSSQEPDLEAAPSPTRADGYAPLSNDPNAPMAHRSVVAPGSFRTLFPFFLIIGVVLLLVWRLVVAPYWSSSSSDPCPGLTAYWARPGDTCWDIATGRGFTLEKLRELNPKLDCERLMPGKTICLPNQNAA